MFIADILWLQEIIDKLAWKHRVMPDEVEQVLFARPHVRKLQKGHRPNEDVFVALGRTEAGRYLSVFFIRKVGNVALILSARDMDRKERRQYERR